MNVPAIRKALKGLNMHAATSCRCESCKTWLRFAVISVGLRACDEWENVADGCSRSGERFRLQAIEDILREAGVEVVNG